MTSDELFWRLVLVTRTVEEAALLWWLAVVRANEHPYREPVRTLERMFGLGRNAVFRARAKVEATGAVKSRVHPNRYTEFTLQVQALVSLLGASSLGHIDMVRCDSAPLRFDPIAPAPILGFDSATVGSRLSTLLRSRDEALLLVWLHQVGAASAPVRVSSRDLESSLLGLVDRRTAMRSMARLQTAGLVTVTPMGRAGTEYRLDGAALHALVHQPFPFHEDAAASMPGWTSLTFPLLQRLTQALPAAATPAAQEAAMEA